MKRYAIITAIAFTILPPIASAAPNCAEVMQATLTERANTCSSAELRDTRASNYCGNITDSDNNNACNFSTDSTRCVPRTALLFDQCNSYRSRGQCEGNCPSQAVMNQFIEHLTPPAEDAGEAPEQIILPRLQVQVPGIKPFTDPISRTTAEGRTFYEIDFIAQYIAGGYRYLLGIVGIVAGIMIVWAGIKWMTAGGMPDRIGSAKKQIAGAIMGVIIALGAYTILFVINPELVRLKPLRIEVVEKIPLGLQEVETEEASETPAQPGQERRIVSVKNEYMENYMQVGEHLQETVKNAAQELYNETQNFPGGPYKLAGGGYRALDEQVAKWKRQCEGRPTCGTPVCNPYGSSALDSSNRLLPGATPLAANCPHTTGQALDLRCSCPSTIDTRECNKYASLTPKFFAPCQKKLEEIMARKGFCRLRSEPWHFENPKLMGTCEQGLVGSAQRRNPSKSWSYGSCSSVYNMQTGECESLPR